MAVLQVPPKVVACQIEGIAQCLGPSTVELIFPLNTAKGSKLSFAAMAGDQVIFQDGIQLPRSPLSVAFGGYAELLSKVFADPRGQFCRQPAENRVVSAKRIFEPRRGLCWPLRRIISAHDIRLTWNDIQAGRLEKMHVQTLLARKMMVHSALCRPCIGFPALHLPIIYDIMYDIISTVMISYAICT